MNRVIVTVSCLVLISSVSFGQKKVSAVYPNELPNYRFHQTAKWNALVPLVSKMKDVRRVMGEPSETNDAAAFTKPYPGDVAAIKPVFTYNLDTDWQLLVYFVKYCFRGYVSLSINLNDTVCSLEFVPRKPKNFQAESFPTVFKSTPVSAPHGTWIEYDDGLGLIYEVYTRPGPYDTINKTGDLNRIVYTAPNETFNKYSGRP